MRPEIKRMNERLAYFLTQMDLGNAHIKHAEERIEELERDLKMVQSHAGCLLARNMELNDIYKKYNIIDFKYNNLIKENHNLENAIKALRESTYQMNQAMNAENDRLERNEKLEKENKDLTIKVSLLMQSNKVLDKELNAIKEHLSTDTSLNTRAFHLSMRNDDLKDELKQAERKNNKLANELVELKQAYNVLDEQYNKLARTQRIRGHHCCDCGAEIDAGKFYCKPCFRKRCD